MIALENQRGFITHYRLCSMKINSLDEPTGVRMLNPCDTNICIANACTFHVMLDNIYSLRKWNQMDDSMNGFLYIFPCVISSVCHNISELAEEHHLENLSPGSKYKVSLAGATRVGEGPQATLTFNTLPENSVSGIKLQSSLMLWSFLFSNELQVTVDYTLY